MLLAIVPFGVYIQDVLGPVVEEISGLNSVQFTLFGQTTPSPFHCTLSLIIGDSPASNGLIGTILIQQ